MTIKFNVPGSKRKELVKTIAAWLGEDVKYCGAPTFAYEIDYFTVARDGALEFDDMADSEEIENLLDSLAQRGFAAVPKEAEKVSEPTENAAQGESVGLTVSVPLDKVNAGNLTALLDAKGRLIQKALGIPTTPIEISEDKISFPWFSEMPDADTVKAYTHFISALCQMTTEQKRISSTEKPVDNEKYAFRCFLLRLGFIGAEYKTERKILLQNLTGSSAFKSGAKKTEVTDDEVSE